MKAPLVTEAQRAALLENGLRAAAGELDDPLPVVRLFTPTRTLSGCWPRSILPMEIWRSASWTWASVCLSWAVSLSDLASIVGPNKQPVMRDLYFQAVRPLSEYLRLAQENGSIVD